MRRIGDISPIQESDELFVYFSKEALFFRINQNNFNAYFCKQKGNNRCRTCPNYHIKNTGKLTSCQTKIKNFHQFKTHLAESEKILGELIAFKIGSKLPDKSIYQKHRMYGYLWEFKKMEKFLMFDTHLKKFVEIERKNITKKYTKFGLCNFCPCNRKLQSSTTIIKHLQVLETRFFCYLILEDERYNDAKNKERLNVYLKCIADQKMNIKIFPDNKNHFSGLIENVSASNDEESVEETDLEYDESIASLNDEDSLHMLQKFRNAFRQTQDRMENFIDELENKVNSTNLHKSIIDTQSEMKLCRRSEDFQEKEKVFTFMKNIDLNCQDLDYLMNKYCIPVDFEIEKAYVTLDIQLKECKLEDQESKIENNNLTHIKQFDKNDHKFTYSSYEIRQANESVSNKMTNSIPMQTTVNQINRSTIENDAQHDDQFNKTINGKQNEFRSSGNESYDDLENGKLIEKVPSYDNHTEKSKVNKNENELNSIQIVRRIKREKFTSFDYDHFPEVKKSKFS